ncbi:MAG: hypothetical protein H6863_06510 [Rhodospirillales bacterium]|nr:hypothetical protein [Rhodospirillales bacterium]
MEDHILEIILALQTVNITATFAVLLRQGGHSARLDNLERHIFTTRKEQKHA